MTSKVKWVSSIENTPVAQGRHSDSAVDMDRRELFGVGEDLCGARGSMGKGASPGV